ncbi:MAG: quinolinate synthase NadA [Planctomycetota bacterium]
MALTWQQPLPAVYRELSDPELRVRIQMAKDELGSRLAILGHHYQQDSVIEFADHRGDSFELSRYAADLEGVEHVIFCGVHFMAETADILTDESVTVHLPDLGAGCSMADMADIDQTEEAWEQLEEVCGDSLIVPVTYMNSSAAIKSFVGEHGGAVCTSSNAREVLEWALAQGDGEQDVKVLFFPDQHLGRNTAYAMGHALDEMVLWDPRKPLGGNESDTLCKARFILWKGHCSVHALFRPEHVDQAREQHPDINVIVHPECKWEVVQKADMAGSTAYIVKIIEEAEPGTAWSIGTEVHLVNRLKHEHPDKEIYVLSDCQCLCTTMYRVDLPHLCWCLEQIAAGDPVNEIRVDAKTRKWSTVALERMLAIRGTGNPVGKDQPRAETVD